MTSQQTIHISKDDYKKILAKYCDSTLHLAQSIEDLLHQIAQGELVIQSKISGEISQSETSHVSKKAKLSHTLQQRSNQQSQTVSTNIQTVRKSWNQLKRTQQYQRKKRLSERLEQLAMEFKFPDFYALFEVLFGQSVDNLTALINNIASRDIISELHQQIFDKRLQELKPRIEKIICAKDLGNISYQGYKILQKAGLAPLLYSKYMLEKTTKSWNQRIQKEFKMTPIGGNQGFIVDLEKVLGFILDIHQTILQQTPEDQLHFKITFDGRKMHNIDQVLLGIIPLHLSFRSQSPFACFPIVLLNCKEDAEIFTETWKMIAKEAERLKQWKWRGKNYQVVFYLCADLKALWSITETRWILRDGTCEFCPWCNVKRMQRAVFNQNFDFKSGNISFFDILVQNTLYCCLHATMRITEKLLRLTGQDATDIFQSIQFEQAIQSVGLKKFKLIEEQKTRDKSVDIMNLRGKNFSNSSEGCRRSMQKTIGFNF
jgi:hypothetical protein